MIFAIIWAVPIYVRFLGFADLPRAFSDWLTGLDQSPMLTLVMILLAYAVLGMFMDAIGMLLITLPVVYPAVMALNGGEFVSAADSTFGRPTTDPTGVYDVPSTLCSASFDADLSGYAIATTTIWFVVSVPVLSEQITVVQPRVSTDGSFRTIALRFT